MAFVVCMLIMINIKKYKVVWQIIETSLIGIPYLPYTIPRGNGQR